MYIYIYIYIYIAYWVPVSPGLGLVRILASRPGTHWADRTLCAWSLARDRDRADRARALGPTGHIGRGVDPLGHVGPGPRVH